MNGMILELLISRIGSHDFSQSVHCIVVLQACKHSIFFMFQQLEAFMNLKKLYKLKGGSMIKKKEKKRGHTMFHSFSSSTKIISSLTGGENGAAAGYN